MMEHVLMNFGDNIRIVNDSKNVPITIGVGDIVRADIHDVHARMIQQGIANETLIICDMELAQRAGAELGQVMQVLRDINQEDYDGLLERFNAIVGPNPEEMRPTREMIRIALREIARKEVRKLLSAQRVTIREQGDERTREEPGYGLTQNPKEPKPVDEPKVKKAAGKAGKDVPNGQGKPTSKIKRERL